MKLILSLSLLLPSLLMAESSTFIRDMQTMIDAIENEQDIVPFGMLQDKEPPLGTVLKKQRVSPEYKLQGRWVSRTGDGLWIGDGWVRLYKRSAFHDARIIVGLKKIYIGFPKTGRVNILAYRLHGKLLGIQDAIGNFYLYKKVEESAEQKPQANQN